MKAEYLTGEKSCGINVFRKIEFFILICLFLCYDMYKEKFLGEDCYEISLS